MADKQKQRIREGKVAARQEERLINRGLKNLPYSNGQEISDDAIEQEPSNETELLKLIEFAKQSALKREFPKK